MGGLQWCTGLVPCTRDHSSAPTRVPRRPPFCEAGWKKHNNDNNDTSKRAQRTERAANVGVANDRHSLSWGLENQS